MTNLSLNFRFQEKFLEFVNTSNRQSPGVSDLEKSNSSEEDKDTFRGKKFELVCVWLDGSLYFLGRTIPKKKRISSTMRKKQ